jgi:hypothetical protein
MFQEPDNKTALLAREEVDRRSSLLQSWLARRLEPDALGWVEAQTLRLASGEKGALAAGVGLAPRKIGRALLDVSDVEEAEASRLVPGFDPSHWTVDQVARVLFVLASFNGDEAAFARSLDQLLSSAEVGERIALLCGLPLYPASERLVPLAGEAIRSAMQPVFEAVAYRNPYPARHFSEPMWNQMVVKALFIGSRLDPIQGLDDRRNADLARMLVDYAHERWAAQRDVSPELWRCVGPFASGNYFTDLMKAFRWGGVSERRAAALALAECPEPEALKALESAPAIWSNIREGRLTWSDIS